MNTTKRTNSAFRAMGTEKKLESVFLFVTGKCNSKCKMCFYASDMDKKEKELTFEEIKRISETAGDFKRLWISGGEPTLREDLPEILEMFYTNNQVRDVNLPTNGLKPDRLIEWVARYRKNCPESNITIGLSLDGFSKTHDKQRGVPGNFYKGVETLKKIEDAFGNDPKVIKNVTTVITTLNQHEVYDFMLWVYSHFRITTHSIEAARGMTREDGVKVLSLKEVQDIHNETIPVYAAYSKRLLNETPGFLRRALVPKFYLGIVRSYYEQQEKNLNHPTPWGMDCTAGETTLVIDYDGRFRACELREPLGNVRDYDCDISKIIHGDAMKKEIEAIGHGYTANCWCTHPCWFFASVVWQPRKMIGKLVKGYFQTLKYVKPLVITDKLLEDIEEKYELDKEKLHALNIE